MSVKSIIIDDELNLREILRIKLEENCPEVEVVGMATNAEEAYDLITKISPQLIFLDINMPGESGLDLLRRLPALNFEIIFVTSYDEYAVEAIEFCALGYIVKPISSAALIKAVQTVVKRVEEKTSTVQNKILLENMMQNLSVDKKIAVASSDGLEFVRVRDIVRCEGFQRYTKIYRKDEKVILSSYSLGKFIKLLEAHGFYTTHKSHLINTIHLEKYSKEGILYMSDGSQVPVSKRKRQEFLSYINGQLAG